MGRGEVFSSHLRPFPTTTLLSTSFEIIRAPEENVCNTGYNLRQVTWLLTGYLDRFMSCLLAETPLPPVIDQLERHQKELHYRPLSITFIECR